MKCPFCGSDLTRVIDTRTTDGGTVVRRRRECEDCNGRFTTYERFEQRPIFVVKKDGRRQRFDRQKILSGIIKACEKRPITLEEMEEMLTEIEHEVQKLGNSEVSTLQIGELVMKKLKSKDRVAYVRFASVYKEFRDLDHFMDIISELKDEFKAKNHLGGI
ncbi:NrdR family transcriptional regulator [Kosmotoga arenicorallina S304]|uniref:Transcriptional repressor NrdR n=1 Tax=Kosmotoga arenicorallina S304 TaxID=1453497 RepID=A0A182C7S6_9BACT|nr:transcriptional regulator NrdR [Kosmotoga arenicorallina]OAA31760.1 NrdR family transcriptional regulator [Kosmotoga arenicorallina S304]